MRGTSPPAPPYLPWVQVYGAMTKLKDHSKAAAGEVYVWHFYGHYIFLPGGCTCGTAAAWCQRGCHTGAGASGGCGGGGGWVGGTAASW
jgi:hypothetical protein